MEDYQFIRAWGQMLGSYSYYINSEVNKAIELNAPFDTVYFTHDNKPVRFKDIENEATMKRVMSIILNQSK